MPGHQVKPAAQNRRFFYGCGVTENITTKRAQSSQLTGDGGWANFDKGLAADLAIMNISVVAISSLKYFFREKTPAERATDVQRVITHYTTAWDRPRVVLIGYSFGADVRPFMVIQLSIETQASIDLVALMSALITILALSPFALQIGQGAARCSRTPLTIIGCV